MAWRLLNRNILHSDSTTFFARYSSKSNPYHVKVGIPEFLNGIGNGVETYAEKLESEFRDLQNLLVAHSIPNRRPPPSHRIIHRRTTHHRTVDCGVSKIIN
ncbi:hypothetical protein L1987_45601 [Smallanthus sonchifolius]|uniref:Uncharacterized protein n=1 Tax=Smallanthus sonchifolius TaxID=185202 RepID=A0ACB9FXI7_9ASTR|nr:hypothetical protein L1987_45601 [Smallanthus sonchifolius]